MLGLLVSALALVTPRSAAPPSRSARNIIDKPRSTCHRCKRPLPGQCVCAALPQTPLVTDTRVLVLQHPAEAKKRIATVPLLPLCLERVSIVKGNRFNADLAPIEQAVRAGFSPLLLFPGPGAICLDQMPAPPVTGQKTLLVLIDGTWTQARHMMRHSPSLSAACTHAMFEAPAASVFDALRREPEKHCMSTAEACARALRLLEPGNPQAQAAARYVETSLEAVVKAQLACIGTRPPRFMNRKRRTWNRQLFSAPDHAGHVEERSPAMEPAATPGATAAPEVVAAPEVMGAPEATVPSNTAAGSAATADSEGKALPTHAAIEELRRLFREDEVLALAPQLLELNPTVDEVRQRVAQAEFLLRGCRHRDEEKLVRASLVQQGRYFTQPWRVAYQDEHVLVCEKPFDTQIAHGTRQRPRYDEEITVVDWAAAAVAASTSTVESGSAAPAATGGPLWPAHQLDFGTSGLLVLARHTAALSAATQAFDSSRAAAKVAASTATVCGGGSLTYWVEKEYCAVVVGWPAWDTLDWEGELDVDPRSPFKMRVVGERGSDGDEPAQGAMRPVSEAQFQQACAANVVDASVATVWGPSRMPPARSWEDRGEPRPRRSSTRIEVIRRGLCALAGPLDGRRCALVRLLPSTGRRHQLRVTLAYLGHPILGDVAYAGDLTTYRLMLHASALTFHRREQTESINMAGESGQGGSSTDEPREDAAKQAPARPTGRRARARERRGRELAVKGAGAKVEPLAAVCGHRIATGNEPFEGVLQPADQPVGGEGRRRARGGSPQMRLRRSLGSDATTDRRWESMHHGARRVVWRHNTVQWLEEGESDAGPISLPAEFDVITGLPDISEIKPKLTPREYESWCITTVRRLVELIHPERVAIFYVTPGRYTGQDGAWLDKGHLCQLGAAQAGAACVWQKVVLIQDSAGRRRGGRPGFVNMLAFSRCHRVPRDFVTVDVLPDRGHMSWSHAIGEEACRHSVEYCRDYVDHGRGGAVLNPFCGYGSVLAVANAYGVDAFGMDISLKACLKAAAHDASPAMLHTLRGACQGAQDNSRVVHPEVDAQPHESTTREDAAS